MNMDSGLALYHGTGRYYEGPPARGHDVLGTGTLSMTASPDIAELFAGGGRDGRVYSLAVPGAGILDLRRQSAALGESGQWDRLASLIRTAREDGYAAVAISDITFGSDSPEFQLLRVPAEGWTGAALKPNRWRTTRTPDCSAVSVATLRRCRSAPA